MKLLICFVASLVVASMAMNLDSQLYEDLLMEDFYRRLALLDDEDPYYPQTNEMNEVPIAPPESSLSEGISLDSRGDGETMIRDSEYVEHSSNAGSHGFIHMSGGAGEGMQHLTPEGTQNNHLEVKTDEGLPFYCHPPNPCPKGYNPTSDECIDSKLFKDTAESQKMWIEAMTKQGRCSCDQEHMFECPKEQTSNGISGLGGSSKGVESREDFDSIFSNFWDDGQTEDLFGAQDKRHPFVVAKKSPRVKRNAADDAMIEEQLAKMKRKVDNPYLQGQRLPTAAKKGMGYQ
ncbi:hypothetical protein CAPTEDRAFT_220347 [Capitella teleta]|uniref:Neuroendocrine protein 7B2 n=1 Tax=Capitella teleta TaxID=283909 RepID=R7U3D5_CAPTE|nr:hypothetical protein CAPTEDRAFT_220347 [Capitella teleta]|eukprot:ELU00636.1 hypothetical protein CAPTEDRAFT_220347 [Capitella teleta]